MDAIEILGIKPDKINLSPSSVVEEIRQNLVIILTTVIGTVPLDRKFGIRMDFIDAPVLRAMMKARIFILETIHEYEPRVEVLSIDFVENTIAAIDGRLTAKVRVRIYDEYIT